MEKISAITKGVSSCEISVLINNTALVKSINNKSGLFNVKTNKLIGEMDNYYTIYNNQEMIYVQRRTKSPGDDKNSCYYLRIYDAKEEKMIVDNFKLVDSYDNNYHFCSLRSPVNGKKYIFNSLDFRDKDMFAKGYDDVEKLCVSYPMTYLVVTLDGKKGIYSDIDGLITEIIYDDIEYINGIIIFTKGNKKGFVNADKYKEVELDFDLVEVDDKFVYAKCDEVISLYGLYDKNLLYTSRCDRLEYITKNDSLHNSPQYFFTEKVGDKYGLIRTTINYNSYNGRRDNPVVENSVLLGPFYDEIIYNHRDGKFYIRQNGKYGLVESSYPGMVFTPAKYDKIVMLYDGFYALYTGNTCDIARITGTPIVRTCEIVDTQGWAITFKKDNKYGVLFSKIRREYKDHDIVLDGYDNIKNLGYGYFELEKDGKKGVCYRGLIIIPIKYENIKFYYHKDENYNEIVCFSLSNNEKIYKLASKRHFNYEDSEVNYRSDSNFGLAIYYKEIKFLPDVMLLRNLYGLFICNYKGETLKTFPVNTNVSMLITNSGSCIQKVLYHIGDEYYFYKDGKFEQALMEECELYATTYESDYGIVVVNSYSEKEHKIKCEKIEDDGEIIFDKKLISYYDEHPEIYEKYPSLVKKKLNNNI